MWPWPDNYRIATTDMICCLCHRLMYTNNFIWGTAIVIYDLSIGTKFGDLDWHWTLCHLLSIIVSLSELSQLIVQIFDTFAFFEPPFGGGGLGTIEQSTWVYGYADSNMRLTRRNTVFQSLVNSSYDVGLWRVDRVTSWLVPVWPCRPYPGIAPGGYSIHYTNPNPYPGANPG